MRAMFYRLSFAVGFLCSLHASAAEPNLRGETAIAAAPKSTINSLGQQLVLIPAGEFLMGGGEKAEEVAAAFPQFGMKAEFFVDEYPQHRVRITKPFWLGKHEVTVAQFKKFVEATNFKTSAEREDNSRRGPGGWGFSIATKKFEGRKLEYNWRTPGFPIQDDYPVVNVSWDDAVAFCQWLSKQEGKTYRLPTEAEWEYACRAGTTTRYWCGTEPTSLAKAANTADADFYRAFPWYYEKAFTLAVGDGHALPAPVGRYPANPFGLCDMHGNAWEWTSDWYEEDYYKNSPLENPTGPTEPSELKVRRGGAWHTAAIWTRASFRNYNFTDSRYPNLGFRVVREQ